jgi:hypothetical protein
MLLVSGVGSLHGSGEIPMPLLWAATALGALEVMAGIFCLNGSNKARIVLIVYSVPILLAFPIGTALGAFSLWALGRPGSPSTSRETKR